MKYDIPQALQVLKPGEQWILRGTEYSDLEWLDSGQQPTEQEVKAKIIELDAAEPMRLLREERDRRLAATDWWASSDLTMSSDRTTYRQALRDLPANQSPTIDGEGALQNVTWPTKPS